MSREDMRKLMEAATSTTKDSVSFAKFSIAKRAKQNKQKHDALVNELAELILNDKAIQKHFKNSRLPRFVEKMTAYKGDITPSMLVTVSKILDDYYSGNVYKTPHKKGWER